MTKKLLIFHPALAPYRVDQFNSLSQMFDLEVVFMFNNVWNHNFDQSKLLSQLQFKVSFLLIGPGYKGKVFRFGMLKAIKAFNPDIILGYEYSFTTQYLILLRRFGFIRQKIGSTIDDSIEICNHIQSKTRRFARKHTVKKLDYLVVLSSEVSQYYEDCFNLKEHQIIVSPILQNPERLRNNPNELERLAEEYTLKYQLKGKKVLLFVGRFIPEKALPRFIRSIYSILLEQKKVVVVLVGNGEDKLNIEAFIKDKQLENQVLLPGRYEGPELFAWYLCASGFILPSTYEPFGAVVNEALIFGLKVFCSKYAGASYLIHSYNGILFDPLIEKQTIDKLNYFLHSINLISSIELMNKPSLIDNYQDDFIKEWRKLIDE